MFEKGNKGFIFLLIVNPILLFFFQNCSAPSDPAAKHASYNLEASEKKYVIKEH